MMRRIALALTFALGLGGQAFAQTADDLFNPEVLQRIDLWLNSSDWNKLKAAFQENTYYPADLVWNGQEIHNVGIRSRGLGSRSATKPGLRVDFDRYSNGQQFLGLKSLVLDNLTQDATGVKESVTMRFYARLGIPAPRETFARLFVNGEYAGLYGLVESVDKTMMGRVFGSIGDDVQNDGYLFEYNYVLGSPWRFTYEGSALAPYKLRFDIKTNESHPESQIWGPIEELVRITNEASSVTFEAAIAERLDLPAFVRYIAAQNFVADFDGFTGYDGMNNFYLYRLEDSAKHALIAWDEDNAFLQPDYSITTRIDENVLTRRVLEIPASRSQYFSALLEAADSATTWLKEEMQRQLDLINAAMLADALKPYSNGDHLAGRDALLNFPEARITYVRCEVARVTATPPPASCR